jgi:UDP-galactose transporter B1
MTTALGGYARLFGCVAGIYFFFLTWGVMQERLASTLYPSSTPNGTSPSRFTSFLLLNLCQALSCALIAFASLKWHGLNVSVPERSVLLEYMRVSLSGSLASPFGYAALKHINYPTMVLGKSCKLLPLVLLNLFVHKRRFETYKYVTVLLITAGVAGFMFFEPRQHKTSTSGSGSWFGLGLLLINLLLDGATNSWQDEMFLKHRIRSHHMMFFMNAFSALYLLWYLLLTNPWTRQLSTGVAFVVSHPSALRDMLMFCVCGAMGQVFIFLTIESFGSMILVTVTVTRKLFTILLSLFWFKHHLNLMQCVSVGLVFVALAIESFFKKTGHHHQQQQHHHVKKE